ncbi:MAG TPA: anaerobic sulfatase maturase [Candidatus Aminicenantes bacterium]|nr:anaerobic sulfatase maturase [Candidatus Aminicenantes bacterium]
MAPVSRSFQVFVKPAGGACNMACRYCYYLDKRPAEPGSAPARMPGDLLETYVAQHFAASPDETVLFSWHGGEPTVLGLDYFRGVVAIERRLCPPGRRFANGLQTNGTLLDDDWGRFLAAEGFAVGISLDGPRRLHDRYRRTRAGRSAFDDTMRGHEVLRRHGVPAEILCVVGAHNVRHPAEVYRFFKGLGASFVTFLPLVERRPSAPRGVSPESVPAADWGDFMRAVFDEWVAGDIGRIKIQIVEEAARTAFGQEHSLCVFRPVCGDVPVLERDGSVYACDHFVDDVHRLGNIKDRPLAELIESPVQRAFGLAKRAMLPNVCRTCDVLEMCNGECPKNRFVPDPEGGPPLNYLCEGYKAFFGHIRPFVDAVAAEWRRQNA